MNPDNIQACLVIVRELYAKYSPLEITEAMKINRAEISKREEVARLQQEMDILTQCLDKLNGTS